MQQFILTCSALMFLFVSLIVISVKDFKSLVIPNGANLALGTGGLIFSALLPFPGFSGAFLGAFSGGLLSYILRCIHYRVRGYHGLGMGDVKFIMAAGCWTGVEGLSPMLFVAALTGLAACWISYLFGKPVLRYDRVPFGPFLCLGLASIAGTQMIIAESIFSIAISGWP